MVYSSACGRVKSSHCAGLPDNFGNDGVGGPIPLGSTIFSLNQYVGIIRFGGAAPLLELVTA
jgi:hypothetical protein